MASPAIAQYNRAYNSFSGVDIKAVGNKPVADLQAISYSITREKAPIYTMGSADPRSFSRAKRGIAGTLIFIVFDRHGLIDLMGPKGMNAKFMADNDDLRGDFGEGTNIAPGVGAVSDLSSNNIQAPFADQESAIQTSNGDQTPTNPWFSDQIPPFDVTLAANNEYGASAKMAILGLEILNEGSGFSIDDIVIEQQMTYVCRTLIPWQKIDFDPRVGIRGGAVIK